VSRIYLEIMPWLSRYFSPEQSGPGQSGSGRSGRVILEREMGDGATVSDLLTEITSQSHEFGEVIFDAQTGRLTGHVTLILNGRLLELAGGLEAELKPGDTLRLMPTLAGG
jgi:molybdopterin converting factor small subunit